MNDFERSMAQQRSAANADEMARRQRSQRGRHVLDEFIGALQSRGIRPALIFSDDWNVVENKSMIRGGWSKVKHTYHYRYLGRGWPTNDPFDSGWEASPYRWYIPTVGLVNGQYQNAKRAEVQKKNGTFNGKNCKETRVVTVAPEMPRSGRIVVGRLDPDEYGTAFSQWSYDDAPDELAKFANKVVDQAWHFD